MVVGARARSWHHDPCCIDHRPVKQCHSEATDQRRLGFFPLDRPAGGWLTSPCAIRSAKAWVRNRHELCGRDAAVSVVRASSLLMNSACFSIRSTTNPGVLIRAASSRKSDLSFPVKLRASAQESTSSGGPRRCTSTSPTKPGETPTLSAKARMVHRRAFRRCRRRVAKCGRTPFFSGFLLLGQIIIENRSTAYKLNMTALSHSSPDPIRRI